MAKRKMYAHSRGKFITPEVVWNHTWPGERWERVPCVEHRIYVSNYGRAYKEVHRNTKHTGCYTPIRVRPFRVSHGWQLQVGETNRYRKMLHLMVADAFQLRDSPKIMVSFKDGNRWNARLSNLTTIGQYTWQKITEPQKQLAKELFKKYPQQQIVTELADRFMVNYRTMWVLYKEFRHENTIAGISTYEHLASNPFTGPGKRLLQGVQDLHLGCEGDLLRPVERSLVENESSIYS